MSPIFVRPVREQLEHDRLIRHLLAKFTRKYEVGANLGDEQVAPLKVGTRTFFPDLVLTTGGKVAGVIEVETGESVNNLEAMAQWLHFSRVKVPFALYVPVMSYDATRRLCEALGVTVSEIWTYRSAMNGFDLLRMFHDSKAAARTPKRVGAAQSSAKTKAAGKTPARAAARSARKTPVSKASKAPKAATRVATAPRKTGTKAAGPAKKKASAASARKAGARKR